MSSPTSQHSSLDSAATVDVIIPAYNAARTIRRTLDSILAQTRPAHTILVVDDGSRDETPTIVAEYAPRIQLIKQQNGGPSVARNRAVSESSSKYIAFLDSDDAWESTKLEKQVSLMEADSTASLCYSSLLNVSAEDGSTSVSKAANPRTLTSELMLGNPGITPSCTLIRRSAFEQAGGFCLDYRGSEDWEFWLRLIELGPFCLVDEPLTLYTVSNTGLSSNAAHMLAEARRIAQTVVLPRLSGWSRWSWSRKIDAAQLYRAALTARASLQRSAGARYMFQSVLRWPFPLPSSPRFKSLVVSLRDLLRP